MTRKRSSKVWGDEASDYAAGTSDSGFSAMGELHDGDSSGLEEIGNQEGGDSGSEATDASAEPVVAEGEVADEEAPVGPVMPLRLLARGEAVLLLEAKSTMAHFDTPFLPMLVTTAIQPMICQCVYGDECSRRSP